MEMSQIRYFLAVCEHKNFTHAARASNVSQPSLTTAIKKLEDELGGELFLRDRAGCRLTPLGALMQPHLEAVQQQTQKAKAEAVRYVRLDRVPISVGIGETIGQEKIVEGVESYRCRHPQTDIELIVESQQALLTGLRAGSFDIAITSIESNPDIYRIDPLYQEGYRLVVGIQHALSNKGSVSLAQLANIDMLDRPNCEMRETLHEACAALGITLYAGYRSNRVDWLLSLVRKGAGGVILPDTAIPNDPDLVPLRIKDTKINRNIVALRDRHQPSRPEANELLRELALSIS